jgi:hypothetical protein
MPPSVAINAFGTLLKRGDGGSPENFTTVTEIVDIDGPNMKQDIVDVTHMQSVGGFRERKITLRDGGTISLVGHYLPTDQTQSSVNGLFNDFINGTQKNFQIVYPGGGSYYQFAAFVTDAKPGAKLGNVLELNVTLTITGSVFASSVNV